MVERRNFLHLAIAAVAGARFLPAAGPINHRLITAHPHFCAKLIASYALPALRDNLVMASIVNRNYHALVGDTVNVRAHT